MVTFARVAAMKDRARGIRGPWSFSGGCVVARMSALVIGMEVAAVLVAYLAFGWPVLLIGAPALVGTVVVLLGVHAGEKRRARLEQERVARGEPAPVPDGLMSGFFQVPAQAGPVDVPMTARRPAGR
jgi:hypothetical protein